MENATYTDDPSISNVDRLWRRIPPWHFYFDENLGRCRPSKAAFEDDQDGQPMSVSLAELSNSLGRGPADVLQGHDGYGLAQITAGLVREYQQGVQRDEQPEDPAHALVFGKKSNAVRRAFAKECQWVVAPPKND